MFRRLAAPFLVVSLGLLAGCGQTPAKEPEPAAAAPSGLANGSFELAVAGRTIHYEVHGKGPVVMHLSNSWGLSLEGLRGLYRPLEADLTMVYFDPRGMGRSSPVAQEEDMGMAAVREDFHAVRDHLGLDKVHAIGWSNGAMNLVMLAAERPETLHSATFVHGVASFGAEDMQRFAESHPGLMQRWMAHQQRVAAPELGWPERTELGKTFWIEEYFPEMMAAPETHGPALWEIFRAAQFSAAHADYTDRASPTFDVRDRLAAITVPSLVIAGAADLTPPAKVKELADGLPDARYVLFEHSGHFSPVEEPARFRDVLLGFLPATP